MKFSVNQVFGCVCFAILYVMWVLIITACDYQHIERVKRFMMVQFDILDGKEINENIEKKRLDFVGFWVTKEEKKQVLKQAKDANVTVSDLCRQTLYLDPVKE